MGTSKGTTIRFTTNGTDLRRSQRLLRCGGCLLIFVLLALPLSAATTYYVDCNGSDSNNGTSTSTPWQTIAKVNGSSFSAGDSVLFQAGCTWREQLTVPSSGGAGNPITFGAYGTGPAPIISGADLLTSWTTEGSLYYSSASTQPNLVFVDGQRLTAVTAKSSLVTGTWWWNSANGRVYAYDNPSGHTIEASQRNEGVYVNNGSYVTVSNLETDKANIYGTYFNTCKGCLATGIVAQNNYDSGLRVDAATSTVVSYSTAAYNGRNGFWGWASPNLLFDHLTAHDNSFNYALSDSAGIKFDDSGAASTGMTVQYSVSYSNGSSAAESSDHGCGIWADAVGTGWTARYNYTYDNHGIGIVAEKDSAVLIYYNISVNNIAPSGSSSGGIRVYENCAGCYLTNSLIANNVAYGNSYHGIGFEAQSTVAGCVNNQISNNISMGNGGDQLLVSGGCENDGTYGYRNTYTYNAFGAQTTNFINWAGTGYSTYTTWEGATGNCGTSGCSLSVQSDPLFKNAAARDFTLQNASPAINAGVDLGSTYQFGLDPRTSFPWGIVSQNSQGSGWEIGAFVFLPQVLPAPPTSLSVTVK